MLQQRMGIIFSPQLSHQEQCFDKETQTTIDLEEHRSCLRAQQDKILERLEFFCRSIRN
jgi:hypothetical protein